MVRGRRKISPRDVAVVLGFRQWRKDVYWYTFCDSQYQHLSKETTELELTPSVALKFAIATIYAEFESSIFEHSNMEQIDGVVAGPIGNKLPLQFNHAPMNLSSDKT